jgi:hypothetical protein
VGLVSEAAPLATPRARPPDDENHGVPILWLAGAAAFVTGLGGALWQSKRRRT